MQNGFKRVVPAVFFLFTFAVFAPAQEPAKPAASATSASTPADQQNPVVERVLREWPEGRFPSEKHQGGWVYPEGFLLDSLIAEWRVTGDGRLFSYVKATIDRSVDKDGVIHMPNGGPYTADAHMLDNIESGRSVLEVYRVLKQPRYYIAAKFLHDQMLQQPKTPSGGYWHKQIYPNQMWLDGAYMAEPFMANYARTFDHPQEMAEVAKQLLLMDEHMRDPKSGLLLHAWDESKKMPWADPKTGLSPEVWGRALGWYSMALVDVLELMPADDPHRAALEDVARRTLIAVARHQDPESGLWWNVMSQPGVKGNYLESSASCMFVYALAKAMRTGILPLTYESNVTRGWAGIQSHFVQPDGTLTGTIPGAGVGGKPYRSGTLAYYDGVPVASNNPHGVGAYILALSEITQRERAGTLLHRALGKTVLVDAWFNSQQRKSADGHMELFHYKFNDDANSGYSLLGRMFQQYGMRTAELDHAPRAEDLNGVAVYILPSPDIPKLNPNTHYMDKESADAIEAWVKAGGVLLLMENDGNTSEFTHFDTLADRFGIHFNQVDRNLELNLDYANTIVPIPAGTGGIFRHSYKALEKEISTITVSAPAKSILTDKGDVVMAVAHVGKGLVYANTDPWLYNEYTDGRKLPLGEQNFAAGQDLVHWVVSQAKLGLSEHDAALLRQAVMPDLTKAVALLQNDTPTAIDLEDAFRECKFTQISLGTLGPAVVVEWNPFGAANASLISIYVPSQGSYRRVVEDGFGFGPYILSGSRPIPDLVFGYTAGMCYATFQRLRYQHGHYAVDACDQEERGSGDNCAIVACEGKLPTFPSPDE